MAELTESDKRELDDLVVSGYSLTDSIDTLFDDLSQAVKKHTLICLSDLEANGVVDLNTKNASH